MSSTDSANTVLFDTLVDVSVEISNPTDLLTRALAASLIVGTSHVFAGPDSWKHDKYVIPGHRKVLGVGDIFLVYREINTPSVGELSMPVFTGRLSHIVAWGNTHIEFGIKNLNTGYPHPKTVKLPLSVIRLSFTQRVKKLLCPFPRCPDPPPRSPRAPLSKHHKSSGIVGDRVPRDSDGLPIWDSC